jgi:hypothetical protein
LITLLNHGARVDCVNGYGGTWDQFRDPRIAVVLKQAEKREREADERKKAAAKRKEDRKVACYKARGLEMKKIAVRKNNGKDTRSGNEGRRAKVQKNKKGTQL